jgi:Ca-activated chloride channel homolog
LKLVELSGGTGAARELPKEMLAEPPEPAFRAGAEASIPGGLKALAAFARLDPAPPREAFLAEYARAIATQTSRIAENAIPKFGARLQQYLASVSELVDLGERQPDGRSVLRLSLHDPKTERAMALLGWRVVDGSIEPGARPEDGARQLAPRALGIDELAMKQALEAGRTVEFTLESDTVPVTGGAAWNVELRAFPSLPGGIAEAFARAPRLARAYAGLAAMPPETAAAMVKHLGLRGAVALHTALWLYGGSFRVVDGAAALPGGRGAEAVWAKLAGASPREPARFFEALLAADGGRVAAFYAALARADEAHQHFFTANVDRAQRWLAWYRDCEELKDGIGLWRPGWQARVFEALPLDRVKDELPPDLEAIVALADLAQRRGRTIDAESAALLMRNFAKWRALFPYFEALPGLGSAEFRALEEFGAKAVTEARLGQWHATAALIVMGRRSGALDDSAAAAAFGALCRSADAIAVVRQIAGRAPTLDEAVASRLLRLEGARLAGFHHIIELQNAPSLDAAAKSGDAATIAEALRGVVYGALLDPAGLLVNEDRGLLRKHVFSPRRGELFAPAALSGAHFTGGFMRFGEVSRTLASGGPWRPEAAVLASSAPSDAPELLFRASGRLVEIHATVTDDRGRLLDGLSADAFSVFDGGRAATIAAFENSAAPLSCVLLLDTSQSMDSAIAALKGAAMRLLRGLRSDDSVAVYSLNGGITELQAFTTDKVAATRAVLRAELGELTALYDGLVRVNRDLAARTGKKVIVVLTDGEDTASALSAETAIRRASMAGVPIYTIAQGHAVRSPALLAQLRGMSQSTGGKPFSVATAAEIGPVFENVLQDLLHGYLLAFAPQLSEERAWRRIEVRLRRPGKVRAREGYFPE